MPSLFRKANKLTGPAETQKLCKLRLFVVFEQLKSYEIYLELTSIVKIFKLV